MSEILSLVEQLKKRLPELEYRLDEMGKIPCYTLPIGLFQTAHRDTIDSAFCIQNLLDDLNGLAQTQALKPALFLAQKINQKMDVLLKLCQLHRYRQPYQPKAAFEMTQLMTREQWLQVLKQEVLRLEDQQKALQCTLENKKENLNIAQALEKELAHIKMQLSDIKNKDY